MAVKVTTTKKSDRNWVTKEVLKDPALRADMNAEGQRLASAANARINSATKTQLAWHVRSWGKENARGVYMVGVYTMTHQAVAHKEFLFG
jgi:hypothetical protein